MKRSLCALLVMMLLLTAMLTGCGAENADSGTDFGEREVDVIALTQQMQSAGGEMPQMLGMNSGVEHAERGFVAVCDLEYEKVEAYSLLYAADGAAYEIAVIKLNDDADSASLEQSLHRHIEKRVQTYRQYIPEEIPRAESAIVAVHGRYAALIMCDDNAAVKAVFDAAFQ